MSTNPRSVCHGFHGSTPQTVHGHSFYISNCFCLFQFVMINGGKLENLFSALKTKVTGLSAQGAKHIISICAWGICNFTEKITHNTCTQIQYKPTTDIVHHGTFSIHEHYNENRNHSASIITEIQRLFYTKTQIMTQHFHRHRVTDTKRITYYRHNIHEQNHILA